VPPIDPFFLSNLLKQATMPMKGRSNRSVIHAVPSVIFVPEDSYQHQRSIHFFNEMVPALVSSDQSRWDANERNVLDVEVAFKSRLEGEKSGVCNRQCRQTPIGPKLYKRLPLASELSVVTARNRQDIIDSPPKVPCRRASVEATAALCPPSMKPANSFVPSAQAA